MLTTMKLRSALVALTAAALLLTGCSGAPAAEPTQSAESPAAVEESSTVAQWASLIAQQKASWEDWEASWDEAGCSGLSAGTESGVMCRIQMMSANYQSQTTSIEYEIATTRGQQDFIAERPHSEVADLFTKTELAAIAARDAGAAWDAAGCSTTAAGECGTLAVTFDRAIDDLLSQFDAWSPYL